MFNMELRLKAIFLSSLLVFVAGLAGAANTFQPREGDRIALVGDTLIEREQESGWLETEMAADFSDRRFIVRNLGWSADTPVGTSRASFDFADSTKAFDLLTGQIAAVKPTVVVFGYGMASSFAGEAGVEAFKAQVNRLIDTIRGKSTNEVRFVIISPIRHQLLPPPLPDPAAHNEQLDVYTAALQEIAQDHGFAFVDLFHWKPSLRPAELTDNGIHLTPDGYRVMADEIARQLGWRRNITKAGREVLSALRQTVVRKDELFFDRWRPQNETYLFGFRKYEQGQNAREIPQFDPLVAAEDGRIAELQGLIARGANLPSPCKIHAQPAAVVPTNQPLPEFTVAPGFEVNLWAENPMLAKPIQMNWDAQGRLWVASSSIYPQIAPGQVANDKIVVLEDTKGQGRADKATVFVDGLMIPQGVIPGDGGCYVGQSTELLHFKGVVGSAKPPTRRVVLSGFGTEDSHHMVHTLRWGPDGMLYFNQSIYIHSHIETPNGVVRLNSGGIFHLRPASMQLGVYLRGFCNPWGHQFDAFGQSFVTDGAGFQGLNWAIPDATYSTYAQMRRELQSVSPGSYPKFCGVEVVASPQFPDDWQGDFITSDFRAHRVVRFSISDEGSGYVTREMPDVLTSTNVTFRPVDEKFGPDGALYIADWSNPIINHGEVDFRDSRRDHEHGRIWRITAKGRPLAPRRDLTRLATSQLFSELLSSNLFDVEESRRVLTERGPGIAASAQHWAARQKNPKAQLEALWLVQSLGLRDDGLLDKVLQSSDARIRAAAVRVLSYWPRSEYDAYERALCDPSPRVRLEAIRAIAAVPSYRSAQLALAALNRPMDPFLDYALWLTINDLAQPWLDGLAAEDWDISGREKQAEFALNAIEPERAGPALDEILKRIPLDKSGAGTWIELIGHAGLREDVDLLYQTLISGGFDAAAAARAGAALNEAATGRGIRPSSGLSRIISYFSVRDEQMRIEAIHLAGNWNLSGSLSRLFVLASDIDTPAAVRDAVFSSIKKIGGENSIVALQPLTDRSEPFEIRKPAVLTLAALDPKHCGPMAVSLLSGMTNEDAALALWRGLLATGGVESIIIAAVPTNGFPKIAGKAGVRAMQESGRNEPELVLALSRAAGLQLAETALSKEEVKKLGEAALRSGDAARGEAIFHRQQQSCLTCHSIGGVGGKVGPDLTSVGTASPMDYLIESVFYPNKEIKDGFQAFSVETSDGEEYSGIPVRETDRELVLRTAADQDTVIAKKQITRKRPIGSLMPSGLADNLSAQEQLDLFRFLSELGKAGPFDASKGNVGRLWKTSLDPAQSADEEKLVQSPLSGEPWHRAVARVSGHISVGDLEKAAQPGVTNASATILAGARFRNVKAGPVRIRLSAPPGTPAWIDGKVVNNTNPLSADLPEGVHTIVLKLDGKDLTNAIQLQSDDGMFLTN
jgi:putative heme-binding domain-containing protein